jgi:hypothetical protein
VAIAALSVTSCYYDNAEELYKVEPCDITAVTYSQDVSVIISYNCLACHSGPTPEKDLDLSTYSNVFANAAKVRSRINLSTNSDTIMPPTGRMSECNIEKVSTWIDQGAINN